MVDFWHQEGRRQEHGQAGRRQSGDRRTYRQAAYRQAVFLFRLIAFCLVLFWYTNRYRFYSRVSLSSYRMKFVWPESIQGLGQQAGKLNLEIELYFCRMSLKYMKSLSEQAGQKNFNCLKGQ